MVSRARCVSDLPELIRDLDPHRAPPSTTSDYGNSAIGNTERIEVAWCTNSGYGTRVIPQGAITGAHFVRTPHYVQVRGLPGAALPRADE